jgi:hypothetical protein
MPFDCAHRAIAAAMLFTLFLNGCIMKEETSKVSTDVAALEQIVHLDFTPASVKWEVFGTPEYVGGVPGSTDIVTLIAEVTPQDSSTFDVRPPAGKIWIAPESARSWLSAPFHAMLDKQKNATVDFSTRANCRALNATRKPPGGTVKGFACTESGRMLVYLTLVDNTQT